MKKQQLPFEGGGWEVGGKAWADDDREDDGEGDGDDDDLVSELATGHPGNQDSGNIYYRSHIIQYMLILPPNSRYEEKKLDKRYI